MITRDPYQSTGWTIGPLLATQRQFARRSLATIRERDGRPVDLKIQSVEPFILHIPVSVSPNWTQGVSGLVLIAAMTLIWLTRGNERAAGG